MALRVALMRSVSLGGVRIDGAAARALATAAGGRDVRSVAATGNLLFRSILKPSELERAIETACAAAFGRMTDIVAFDAAGWRAFVEANPFGAEALRTPERVVAWAMRDPLRDRGLSQLERRCGDGEKVVRVARGHFYCLFGGGPPASSRLLSGFGLKSLGAVGTNRTWNTVARVTKALDEMEAEQGDAAVGPSVARQDIPASPPPQKVQS